MNNYQTYKLNEICKISTGKWDANHAVENGHYRFYTCSNKFTMCDTASFNGKCVIVPGNGDLGLLFYYNGEFDAYQRTYVLYDIKIDAKYLYYHMMHKWRSSTEKLNYGSTIRYVRITNFTSYEIEVPDKTTQQSIVTRIETLFAELDKAVQHLRTAQQQLKTYRQAVLKVAFEECDSYEKITNCFDVTGGLTKNSQREKFSIKMPYLRVANVYYNRLDLSEIKEIGVQESEIKDKLLKKEDLLFVEGNGSKEQIGRVAVWDGSIENCLHQNHIIKGRPLGTMLSKFALYYFISDFGREQILKVASSTSGLYTLSTEKVRNLKVPSCSLTEQQRIVNEIESRLSQATASETYIENALQQAEALRQSILKKAFEGELV